MSRSTIGGVLGAAIGFVVTGFQPTGAYWGWVIGSGVGALTDNTKTYGPRAGDASQQASQDGAICTYGYGEFTTTGVILWRDERKEKEVSHGKGGPKNVTFEYTWSYAIGVSKKVGAYLIIERNGTRVYDARSDAELLSIGYTSKQIAETRAAQTKFLQRAKLYLGDYDQLPDPTIQAVKGIDNVPNYGGRAYIVLTDDPVTNDGAAIPQYRFVVAECGHDQSESAGYLVVTGSPTAYGEPMFAEAQDTGTLSFVGIPQSTGADLVGGSPGYYYDEGSSTGVYCVIGPNGARVSTDKRASWQTISFPYATIYGYLTGGPSGWVGLRGAGVAYDKTAIASVIPTAFTPWAFAATPTFTHGEECYATRYTGGFYYFDVGARGYLAKSATLGGSSIPLIYQRGTGNIYEFYDWCDTGTELYAAGGCTLAATPTVLKSTDGGVTFAPVFAPVSGTPRWIEAGNGIVLVLSNNCATVWTSADNFAVGRPTGIQDNTLGARGRMMVFTAGKFYIVSGQYDDLTKANKCVTTADGITFSAPVSTGISNTIGIAAAPYVDPVYSGTPIPDAPGHYVDPITGEVSGPPESGIIPCDIRLSDIVVDQCAIRSVTRVIASELHDDIVRGFRVATQTSPKDNIRSLQGTYCFDASDYDSYLRFLKRPQPDTFFISKDDLVANENRPIDWDLTKENDLLVKVSIGYFDPRTNYSITQQSDERGIGTIKAQGEGVFDSALTATATFMKQVAHKSWKIAWAEKDMGKFTVRLNHAARYVGEWGKLEDECGVVHVVRITNIQNDGVVRHITVRKTSRSAYTSNALGVNSPLPSFPGSGLLGPTLGSLWNLPVLYDTNDKPGLIWAPAGVTSGWAGAVLELQRSGAWEQAGTTTRSCNIGTLLSDLPANDGPIDESHTLQIRLNAGIFNLTFEQFLNEGNPLAIRYPDGTAEVLQCQFATPVSDGVYDCTRLLRGRLDTVNGNHAAGAEVVFLDTNLQFIQMHKDDIGKTINYRVVTSGTDPDMAPVQTITLTTMESQREWQPYNVSATKDADCQWLIDWVQRPRLGTDANPIQSQWWVGDRIDFITGGVTKSRMTRERPFLYTAAMQIEDWGAVRCAGYAVNVAAVNEYTGSDGSGGTGGGTGAGDNPNYPATIIGSPSDGYVGEPIFDPLGPTSGSPFQAYGGMWDELFVGEIVANVTCQSQRPGEGVVFGVPLTAETRNAATELIPSGPLVVGGPFLITDSVTIAAKPTYGMMDESLLSLGSPLATPVTTPARVAKTVPASGFGGIASRAGFSSGFHWAEFVITGLAGGSIAIGVHAGSANSRRGLSGGVAGHYAYAVGANGTYMVTVDASTGAVEVFKLGVGSVATGTLGLTYSFDGKYRFAWNVVNAAPGATVRCNQGNETPAITPPVGSSGVPNVDMIVPCGFDVVVATASSTRLKGELSLVDATAPLASTLNYAYAAFGKSTGKWRIGMTCGTTGRIGFCKAGHAGLLGASGTADSIGFTDTRSPAGYVIETSFGGVFNRIVIPPFAYYSNPIVRFALDADAGTLDIYVKVEITTGDPTAVYELLVPLTDVPTGTWLPALNGSGQLTSQLAGPATYDDWTLTL